MCSKGNIHILSTNICNKLKKPLGGLILFLSMYYFSVLIIASSLFLKEFPLPYGFVLKKNLLPALVKTNVILTILSFFMKIYVCKKIHLLKMLILWQVALLCSTLYINYKPMLCIHLSAYIIFNNTVVC